MKKKNNCNRIEVTDEENNEGEDSDNRDGSFLLQEREQEREQEDVEGQEQEIQPSAVLAGGDANQ